MDPATEKAQTYSRLEHADPKHSEYIVVNWCLGNVCNFECSYCPSSLHDGSRPWTEIETITRFMDQVFDHYGPQRKYFFEFTGGEVTLYKDFLKLAEYLKGRGARLGIISNASRSMEFWSKARPLLDQICISFQPEFSKPEHTLSVIRFLSETVRTHVNVMMLPSKFDECLKFADEVKTIPNLSMALQPLIVDFGTQLYPYTPEQKKILERQFELYVKHIPATKRFEVYRGAMSMVFGDGKRVKSAPHRFISTGQNNWQGWECHAGLEQFVVDMEGSIYRGWCLVGGKIGLVNDEKLNLPTAPVVCTKSSCHCNFDIMSTKAKR